MEAIQDQAIKIISIIHQIKDMEEIVQVLTSLYECVKTEYNYVISDIKDLREETNDSISDVKDDISTLEKKSSQSKRRD